MYDQHLRIIGTDQLLVGHDKFATTFEGGSQQSHREAHADLVVCLNPVHCGLRHGVFLQEGVMHACLKERVHTSKFSSGDGTSAESSTALCLASPKN